MQTMSAPWRKSSYSTNGGQNCVEVGAQWRKSSYSGNGGQNCVEVGTDREILIRDTKDHGRGPVLRVSPAAFAEFTARVRRGAAL